MFSHSGFSGGDSLKSESIRNSRHCNPASTGFRWGMWFACVGVLVMLPILAVVAADRPDALVSDWLKTLEAGKTLIDTRELSDTALADRRTELDRLRAEMRVWISDRAPEVEALRVTIEGLGALPAEGEPAEAPAIAAERERLNTLFAAADGQLKQVELALNRANSELQELAALRRERFTRELTTRQVSPLALRVWAQAWPQLVTAVAATREVLHRPDLPPELRQRLGNALTVTLVTIIGAALLALAIARWLLRQYGRDLAVERPGYLAIARATVTITAANALLPSLVAGLLYLVVRGQGLLTDAGSQIARSVLLAFVLFVWVTTLFRASLAPRQPAWRLVPVPNPFARGLRGIVIGLALVFAVDVVLSELIAVYGVKLEVLLVRDFLTTLVVTLILFLLLKRSKIWIASDRLDAAARWPLVRAASAALLGVNLVCSLLGYVALARFLVTQIAVTGALLFLVLILHRLGREVIERATAADTWSGHHLRESYGFDEAAAGRAKFWLGLAHDALVIMVGIVVGLLAWGADRTDIGEWTYQLLFGLKIGNLTFSLIDVPVAVLVFIVVAQLTRLAKKILAEKILPQTQLDLGTQQSLTTGLGYLGFILAAVVAISALGLAMTNLAIVAGALSVGIGFGLQNVVNNFVSGIILLVERPVKVGDWVVVGSHEGYVSRIKVRATELTTFDRSNVFVPNSELISSIVTNMTYADKLGRIIIPVGVAYGSDTRKVQQLLLEVAVAHPQVFQEPCPTALFRGFGDSALDFELRCFLKDVENTVSVTSDLCFAIDAAFRVANIEIPFPQRDVHVRGLPSDTRAK